MRNKTEQNIWSRTQHETLKGISLPKDKRAAEEREQEHFEKFLLKLSLHSTKMHHSRSSTTPHTACKSDHNSRRFALLSANKTHRLRIPCAFPIARAYTTDATTKAGAREPVCRWRAVGAGQPGRARCGFKFRFSRIWVSPSRQVRASLQNRFRWLDQLHGFRQYMVSSGPCYFIKNTQFGLKLGGLGCGYLCDWLDCFSDSEFLASPCHFSITHS